MNKSVAIVLLVVAPLTFAVAANAQGLILQPGSFSADDLIEELQPRPKGTLTRNFKVKPAGAMGSSTEGALSVLVTFRTNSAEISSQAAESLDIVAKALRAKQLSQFQFQIEGHADPRGDDEYNRMLSQARAETVATYLSSNHGISPDRLLPVGKGTSQVINHDRPAAPENRRVTIVRQ